MAFRRLGVPPRMGWALCGRQLGGSQCLRRICGHHRYFAGAHAYVLFPFVNGEFTLVLSAACRSRFSNDDSPPRRPALLPPPVTSSFVLTNSPADLQAGRISHQSNPSFCCRLFTARCCILRHSTLVCCIGRWLCFRVHGRNGHFRITEDDKGVKTSYTHHGTLPDHFGSFADATAFAIADSSKPQARTDRWPGYGPGAGTFATITIHRHEITSC
jgi:hypothetical protein